MFSKRDPIPGRPKGRATFFVPRATWPWPGAAAKPGAIPLIGNAITLIGNAITFIGNAITLNGNAGVGWGGVGWSFLHNLAYSSFLCTC